MNEKKELLFLYTILLLVAVICSFALVFHDMRNSKDKEIINKYSPMTEDQEVRDAYGRMNEQKNNNHDK